MAPTALFTSLLALYLSTSHALASDPKDAILLSKVQSLTLKGNNALTTHRRVPAAPQLKCISSPELCALVDIDVMRCKNTGSSYGAEDIEWSCSTILPPEVVLSGTEVICEGYENSDDPRVLKGSCGVEYRLRLTDAGEGRYSYLDAHDEAPAKKKGWDSSAIIFAIIFLGILGWILYSAYCEWYANNAGGARNAGRRPRRNGGGGHGGGDPPGPGFDPGYGGPYDDNDDDPPPPYPGSGSGGTSSRKTSSTRSSNSRTNQQAQAGWRPGFWSGLGTGSAAGGAAGYAAGRRSAQQTQRQDPREQPVLTRSLGSRSGSGSASSGGFSSSPRESTGFGSTSRR